MTAETVEVKGLKELERALKKLPPQVARKVLRSATLAGAAVVRTEAKANAAGISQRLSADVRAWMQRGQPWGKIVYSVGLKKKAKAWWGRLFEFGTSPHTIKPKLKKFLAWTEFGEGSARAGSQTEGKVFARRVQHPGFPAHPWLRPAFDNKARAATDKIKERLGKGIEREAAKLR